MGLVTGEGKSGDLGHMAAPPGIPHVPGKPRAGRLAELRLSSLLKRNARQPHAFSELHLMVGSAVP